MNTGDIDSGSWAEGFGGHVFNEGWADIRGDGGGGCIDGGTQV